MPLSSAKTFDLSNIILNGFSVENETLIKFKKPLILTPRITNNGEFFVENETLDIWAIANTRQEAIDELLADLAYNWKYIVCVSDEQLGKDLQRIKQNILAMVLRNK
jgi:hypothetical protein